MEDFFRWTIIGMTPMGLWPLPNKPLAEFWKPSIAHINNFFEGCVVAAELNQFVQFSENVVSYSENILYLNTSIMILMKNCTFICRRDLIREILATLDDLYENTPLPKMDGRITATTLKWKKRTNRMMKLLLTLYGVTSFIYLDIPSLIMMNDITELPYPLQLPYDTTNKTYFVLTYIVECLVDTTMVLIFFGVESFFASVVMFVCSRVELLQCSIGVATEEAIIQKKTTPLFGICLEYHKKILKTCELLQDLYSFATIVQFFGSTFCLCTICFLLIQGDSDQDTKIKYFIFFISLVTQLFIYCLFGQILENQFENLAINWHDSAWYNAPLCYQKDIKFYMAKCLQPVTFTVYKVMPLNVETFVKICQTSVSYIALLQNLQEEKQ